jgi:hypothetical protein
MKIVIDEIDYPVKEMGIDQYQAILSNENIGDLDLISLFVDVEKSILKRASFQNLKFVASMLRHRIKEDDMESPLNLTYRFKGKDYGLIIPQKISYEEWVNLEVFLAKNPIDMKLIAAHLYKPLVSGDGDDRVLEDYSMEECIKRSKMWGDFPMSIFVSALFFLGLFSQILTQNILSSLETKTTENKQEKINQPHKK